MFCKQNFIVVRKIITLYTACALISFSLQIQADDHVINTANMLTQVSYTSPEMKSCVLILTNKDADDAHQNMPSVPDIINKICSLQNSQGFIKNEQIRKKAITALKTAIQATDNALSAARMPLQHTHMQHILPTPYDDILADKLITTLTEHKKLLHNKMTELHQTSIWHCFAKPSIPALATGVVLSMIMTGITTAYYCGYFDKLGLLQNPIVCTGKLDPQTKKTYKNIHTLFHKFMDPTDKDPITFYIQESKRMKEELNPQAHQAVVEVLDTIIEIETKNRMNIGITEPANDFFWIKILLHRNYYEQIFNHIVQHNNPHAQPVNFTHIDFKQLWKEKGWI